MTVDSPVTPTPTIVPYLNSNILFNRETGYYSLDGVVIARYCNNNVASFGSAGASSIVGYSALADTLSGMMQMALNALQTIKFKDGEDELRDKALSISRVLNNALEQAYEAEANDEEDYHNE